MQSTLFHVPMRYQTEDAYIASTRGDVRARAHPRMSEAVALQNCGGKRSTTTDSHMAVKASLAPTLSFLTLSATFAH